MTVADMLPTLDETSLLNLRTNAVRLAAGPDSARHKQAAVLLPLIEAEITARAASKPPKPKPAPRARKTAPKAS